MNADRCIVCGEVIPEGRQVCPSCEKSTLSVKEFKTLYPHICNTRKSATQMSFVDRLRRFKILRDAVKEKKHKEKFQ